MNSSCHVNANESIISLFFILGFFLTILGVLLNICSCLLFCRAKSLFNTPYAIFIIALSIADIIKLFAEYCVHLIYYYIQYPYFVCSITWFLTLTSENTSYAFLCALGIERNLKVWTTDRRYLITRRRACLITCAIIILICLYNHLFLFIPSNVFYCYFEMFNRIYLFSCIEAQYYSYGYTYKLTDLLTIENFGLNNIILPFIIISTNIILIIGLRRRTHQRRHRLGSRKSDDWRERSLILYMLLSSLSFLCLTAPIGFLFVWEAVQGRRVLPNNLEIIFDLMEILHHCSHFPILLMTSSIIRSKTYQILFHPRVSRQNSFLTRNYTVQKRLHSQSSSQQGTTTNNNNSKFHRVMANHSTAS